MSKDANSGNPAFPVRYDSGQVMDGLTKREYIATQLMAGILADGRFEHNLSDAAREATHAADALLQRL